MASIFDSLPGLEVPVASINRGLEQMWEDTAARGGAAPAADDARATQVNFVLHLGFNTTAADAVEQFRVAVDFSKRSPCRVVVLCPLPAEDGGTEMRAKIYGECHLGRSRGDTRCCEFVLLSYPFAARRYLESELSVCLVGDLPLYYWVHRFASLPRLIEYQHLLNRSQRILIDSALTGPEVHRFPWPRPEAVHDLVYARLLPLRQSIGQLLSAYAPETLVAGLGKAALTVGPDLAAEGNVLAEWTRRRLAACGGTGVVACESLMVREAEPGMLNLEFEYSDGRSFQWQGNVHRKSACISANLGQGLSTLHVAAGLLPPDAALSDAMFF